MGPSERATGIEPVSLAWKAKALPLSHARAYRGHYTINPGLWKFLAGNSEYCATITTSSKTSTFYSGTRVTLHVMSLPPFVRPQIGQSKLKCRNGNRIKSVLNGVTTYYVDTHFEWTGSTSLMIKYYYAGGQRVAMRVGGNAPSYLLGDHLGSTSITANSSGGKVAELRYHPWGGTRFTDGATPTARRFTGQVEDVAIGLYFYNARYYDPTLGRFLQADSIVPSPANPQSLNRYSYVLNSPLRYIDPTGHAHWVGEEGDYHWLNPYTRPKPTLQSTNAPDATATLASSTQQSESTRVWLTEGETNARICGRWSGFASDTAYLRYERGGFTDGFVEGGVHTGESILGIATYNHEWQYRQTWSIWRGHTSFGSSYTVTEGGLFMAAEASMALDSGELSTAAGVDVPFLVGGFEYRQDGERINELSYGMEAPLAGPTVSVGVIWQTSEKVVLQTTRGALCVTGGLGEFSRLYGPGGMALTGYTILKTQY